MKFAYSGPLLALAAALAVGLATAPGAEAKDKGCPPGLAKKHNGCLPPGIAKKVYRDDDHERYHDGHHRDEWRDWRVGERWRDHDEPYYVLRPSEYDRYGLSPYDGQYYIRTEDSVLRLDRKTNAVIDIITGLDTLLNN